MYLDERRVLEVVLHVRGQMTYLWKGSVSTGDQGQGETNQINHKMNFIQVSFQKFSQHFKSTFTYFFRKSNVSYK